MRPADTTLDAQRFQWNSYAALTPSRRLELMSAMCGGLSIPNSGDAVNGSLDEFLLHIVERLESAGVPYMVVGSVAAGIWATPRYTQDVDVVVNADPAQARKLAESFGDEFYVGDLETAAQRRDMANLINPATGWKADFIWTHGSEWDVTAFARRVSVTILGRSVFVISAEDLVVAKLRWALSSGSEMQLRDVANVLNVASIDRTYLSKWVAELGLEDILAKAEEEPPDTFRRTTL